MRPKIVGLFLEDFAQEQYIKPLVSRVLSVRGIEHEFRDYVCRGGRPAVLNELRAFFHLQSISSVKPDFIVIGIDGNCQGFVARRNEVMGAVPSEWRDRVVAAIPDPHIEAWFFRDLEAFHRAVGKCGAPPKKKCDKNFYKKLLKDNTFRALEFCPLGGIENASAIVDEQDLKRLKASGNDLNRFISDLEKIT